MNFQVYDRRDRRSFPNQGLGFGSIGYTIANYSTDSVIDRKVDMKPFHDNILDLNRISCIPDPLKKNLADTVITSEPTKPEKMPPDPSDFLFPSSLQQENEMHHQNISNNIYAPLQSISSFFSSFFGALTGSVFQRRAKSPVETEYYDCFDNSDYNTEMPPPYWQSSRMHDQNKNLAPEQNSVQLNDNMSNYRATVAQCEQKLTVVKGLLPSKNVVAPPKFRRRPKKIFVEPGSVQESAEDTFMSDEYVSLPNGEYLEYVSVQSNHSEDLAEIHGAKMKVEERIPETDIVKVLPESHVKAEPICHKIGIKSDLNIPVIEKNSSESLVTKDDGPSSLEDIKITSNDCEVSVNSSQTEPSTNNSETNIGNPPKDNQVTKQELISSVEDKMAKLKTLLQEKRRKPSNNSNLMDSVLTSAETTENTGDKNFQTPVKCTPNEISQDKRFKNPHRLTDKRKKSKLRRNIQDDMRFAHEIESDDISSVENSPRNISSLKHLQIPQKKCSKLQNLAPTRSDSSFSSDSSKSPNTEYFDELKGRFHPGSATDSEDSFQIVFADSPKKCRRPSDCESEDSFIVFEDSPDSCYTSHDIFGDHETTDSECETDSEPESDSGCNPEFKLKLSQHLSRTISDLTDDSLYEDIKSKDELDCAVRTFDEIPNKEITNVLLQKTDSGTKEIVVKPQETVTSTTDKTAESLQEDLNTESDIKPDNVQETDFVAESLDSAESVVENVKHGLLLDEAKKLLRKQQPKKKVSFSTEPPKVRVMRVWAFAARQARAGHWERHALDRERFKRRIADVDMAVSWVLKPQHRNRVMFQRFMPWWNHLKRLEIAEKKRLKEEEEQRKKEEEERRIKEEEERKVREEEERIKAEQERVIREEEEKRRQIEGVSVDNKAADKNIANGKQRLLNNKYNKPRSVYLKQKTKKATSNVVNNKIQNNISNANNISIPNSMKSEVNINSSVDESISKESADKISVQKIEKNVNVNGTKV